MTDLRALQRKVYQNKLDKQFNVTDVSMEFCFLHGELTEAYMSYIKQKGDVGEELADVAIYLLGLSEILGVDLGAEIDKKIEINANRQYIKEGDAWQKLPELGGES